MDSTGYYCQRIVTSLTISSLVIVLTACAHTPTASFSAPRSTVTRAKALTMARQVAASIDGKVYAVAPSGSMLPTLDEGSIVTVETVSLDKLKRGDIVIYRNSSDVIVIHRLYEKHQSGWFVLGDNNASIDRDTVSSHNLLGRVCAIFYTSADSKFSSQAAPTPAFLAVAQRE